MIDTEIKKIEGKPEVLPNTGNTSIASRTYKLIGGKKSINAYSAVNHTICYSVTTNCGLSTLRYTYGLFYEMDARGFTFTEMCNTIKTMMGDYSKIQIDIKKDLWLKYRIDSILGTPIGYMEYPSQYKPAIMVMAIFNRINFPDHTVLKKEEIAEYHPKSKMEIQPITV